MAFDPTKDYITRMEKYLTKMAGNNDVDVPEPITRFEHYLKAIVDNISSGGGGGGGGGVFLVETEIVNLNVQLKKTWKEITDAAEAGSVVVLKTDSDNVPGGTVLCYLSGYGMDEYEGEPEYYVEFLQGEMPSPAVTYASTGSESGYPTINV